MGNGEMIEMDDDLSERDEIPPADEESAEYKAGFHAGTDGDACISGNPDWQRGRADAQE
jgi:hypothetical protein